MENALQWQPISVMKLVMRTLIKIEELTRDQVEEVLRANGYNCFLIRKGTLSHPPVAQLMHSLWNQVGRGLSRVSKELRERE